MKRFPVLLSAIFMALTGCMSEKDASDVVLLVSQSDWTAAEGETVRFGIETWTIHDRLVSLDISSYDRKTGITELDSRPLDTERYTGEYIYRAPAIESEQEVLELIFSVTDNLGNTQKVSAFVTVVKEDGMLEESATSVLMYSPDSGKPDGFSISTLQSLYVIAAQDTEVDIYVPQNPDSDVLGKIWRSKSGLRFAKMTGVDYSTISASGLTALYANASKNDMVTDISTGDVILIGTDASAEGIILVTGVFDEAGTAEDRYMFNIKMLH